MTDITIPPEALEAAARAHAKMNEGHDEWWFLHVDKVRAACPAMLKAWEADTHRMIFGTALDEVGGTYPAIILPLKENTNDKT